MSLFYAWAVLKLCTPLHTHNGELSGGWIVVQSGVHDAGVHSCVVLCNISDGEAVRVHDQSAKTFSRSLWTEWMCFFFFYNIQYTKDPAYIHNSTQIPDKDLIFLFLTAGFKKEDISGYKKLWPLIVRQLSVIFEPGHRGNERRVVFYRALKHHRSAPLDFFVFWLLQDSGWLCWGKNKVVQELWNCHVFAPSWVLI